MFCEDYELKGRLCFERNSVRHAARVRQSYEVPGWWKVTQPSTASLCLFRKSEMAERRRTRTEHETESQILICAETDGNLDKNKNGNQAFKAKHQFDAAHADTAKSNCDEEHGTSWGTHPTLENTPQRLYGKSSSFSSPQFLDEPWKDSCVAVRNMAAPLCGSPSRSPSVWFSASR